MPCGLASLAEGTFPLGNFRVDTFAKAALLDPRLINVLTTRQPIGCPRLSDNGYQIEETANPKPSRMPCFSTASPILMGLRAWSAYNKGNSPGLLRPAWRGN